VVVAGRYAYIVADGVLRIVDVANPAAPTEVGVYDTPGYAWDVAVAGHYTYIADGEGGLRIVDVANPATPAEVGFYATPGSAEGVAVAGRYAYVADGVLRILDVANPAAPTEVGFYDTTGWAGDVVVAGRYAYVAATWGFEVGGLCIVAVSNPTASTEVGCYDTGWNAGAVTVVGQYAYVADGYRDLWILDVGNPAAPTQVGFYATLGSVGGVVVAGDYAYVADGDGGLLILRFAPSAAASIPTTGGSLISSFDQTSYTFATGTFPDTVTITHTTRLPGHVPSIGQLAGIDHFFEVTAVYSDTGQPAQPTQPYTVTVQYTDDERGPAIEDTLALYWWDGTQWVREPTSGVDTTNNTVTTTPARFGLWAVLGETRRMLLPVISKNYGGLHTNESSNGGAR
jgi:hypothetical protein